MEFSADISDNALNIPSQYNPEYNCTVYLNDSLISTVTTNTTSITYTHNISLLSEAQYNWSYQCSDQSDNFNISDIRYFTIDRTAPDIISNTTSSVSSSGFTISANVSESSIIIIYYSTNQTLVNESYQNAINVNSSIYSNNPTLAITGLLSSTVYYYKFQICDQANNCGITSEILSQTTSVTSSSSSSSSSSGGGGGGSSRCVSGYVKQGNSCIKIVSTSEEENLDSAENDDSNINSQEQESEQGTGDFNTQESNEFDSNLNGGTKQDSFPSQNSKQLSNQITGAATLKNYNGLPLVLGFNIFLLLLTISLTLLLATKGYFYQLAPKVINKNNLKNRPKIDFDTDKFTGFFEVHKKK